MSLGVTKRFKPLMMLDDELMMMIGDELIMMMIGDELMNLGDEKERKWWRR